MEISNKQKTINQGSDSANSHGYSPYQKHICKKNRWTPKETDQTSMFCKRTVSKGLGLEVLMTMVILSDVYIPKKTHRTYFFDSLPDFSLPVSMGLSISGNICGHQKLWQRPSDNLVEVFGPNQITNLRARVDGWQRHVVHGVPKSNAPGEKNPSRT